MDDAAPACGHAVPTSRAPRAAGIRRTRPRKRLARAGALPFFQLRPALLDPLMDGLVVALGRSPCRSLPAPLQILAQERPNVRWVIPHACQSLDHLGHTLQGPHVIRIAVCCRTFEQLLLDVREFVSAQFWQSPSTTCTNQSISP